MPSPEELAREKIDALPQQCGWVLQKRSTINLSASRGIAIREALLKDRDEVDYLLFVDGKAIGTVEAKPLKASQLTGVEEQSGKYGKGLLDIYPKWREPLPFAYESTGVETQFTNQFDPSPKSRNVFGFHRPETLLEYLEPDHQLNTRLSDVPVADQMPTSNLACYNPKNRHERKDSERFKSFSYDELLKRDKLNLDIFWLKDESLEDSANLPNPDIIAAEIVEDLQAALAQFAEIASD